MSETIAIPLELLERIAHHLTFAEQEYDYRLDDHDDDSHDGLLESRRDLTAVMDELAELTPAQNSATTTTTETVYATVEAALMAWPWSRPLRVYLKDGTSREGILKSRTRRGIDLSDRIEFIAWDEIEGFETGGQA